MKRMNNSANALPKEKMEIKVSDFLFYIFLVFMFFAKGIGRYDGQVLYSLLFWSAMLCAAGKILMTNYTKKQWIWVILLGILAVLIERHSGEKGVLICYAVVIGMKDIPLKRIMQVGAVTFGVTMCAMVTYYGVFLEQSTYRDDGRIGMGQTIRYALGYPHPNNLLATYLALISMVIYCLGKKYNWKYAMALMLGNVYLYSYCMSYTGIITCSLVILLPLYLMNIRHGKLGIAEYCIGGAALPLCLWYSFFVPYILPEKIVDFLDWHVSTLYSRLRLSKEYVNWGNMSLLGTRVSEVTTSEFSLDNSFLYAFIFNGVIFFVIIIVAYVYMMYRLIKEKRDLELIITCIFLLEGAIEPLLFNTSFKNITLFFLGNIIWKNSERAERQSDSIMMKIPIVIKEKASIGIECWNKSKKKIIITSIGTGILLATGCVVKNVLADSGGVMRIEVIRSSVAMAWMIVIVIVIFMYIGCYIKENYRKY